MFIYICICVYIYIFVHVYVCRTTTETTGHDGTDKVHKSTFRKPHKYNFLFWNMLEYWSVHVWGNIKNVVYHFGDFLNLGFWDYSNFRLFGVTRWGRTNRGGLDLLLPRHQPLRGDPRPIRRMGGGDAGVGQAHTHAQRHHERGWGHLRERETEKRRELPPNYISRTPPGSSEKIYRGRIEI